MKIPVTPSAWLPMVVAVTSFLLTVILPRQGVSGLQCFRCTGFTSDHSDDCYRPDKQFTSFQECDKDQWCEKKVTRYHRHEKIERGCSANCVNRPYIWTEVSEVFCCEDTNLCNSGVTWGPRVTTALWACLVAVLFTFFLGR